MPQAMPNALQHPAKMTGAPAQRTFSSGIKRLELIGQHPTGIKKKLKRALADIGKGNNKKSSRLLIEIVRSDPENIDALNLLGHVYMILGDSELAERMFLRALGQAPDNVFINDTLGKFYHSQSLFQKAALYLQKVYELAPDNRPNLVLLARCFCFLGMNDIAMSITRELVNLENSEPCLTKDMSRKLDILLCDTISESKSFYISCYPEVERLFSIEHIDHMKLAPAAVWLLCEKHDISNRLDKPINLDALGNSSLLLNLLNKSVIQDITMENWLARVRRKLFDEFMATGSLSGHEKLASSLGIHNFINEYVQPISDEEMNKVEELCKTLDPPPDKHALLTIGLYRPLISIPGLANQLNDLTSLSETTARLLEITLKEPMEEKIIADNLNSLGTISDSVSQMVQDQYEENPYPRWRNTYNAGKQSYTSIVRKSSPSFDPPSCLQQKPLNILVAGSGTGRHPITLADQVMDSQILAVDISRTSLAYGKRIADKLEIKNIEFIQADILNLSELNGKFPVIESCGVLHHMNDPERGWEILRNLLEPGGVMHIGLYSQTARRDVDQIRKHITEHKIEATPANIRQYRKKLLNDQLSVKKGAVSLSPDAYSLSGFRDLCFHAKEHQFNITRIKHALENLGLRFLGFNMNRKTRIKFEEQHPRPEEALDLDKYSAFENQWPETFCGMYQFYCTTVE